MMLNLKTLAALGGLALSKKRPEVALSKHSGFQPNRKAPQKAAQGLREKLASPQKKLHTVGGL